MVPNTQILNYLFWLQERGITHPIPYDGAPLHDDTPATRFVVALSRPPQELPPNELALLDKILAATGLPRVDFFCIDAETAWQLLETAAPEWTLCFGVSPPTKTSSATQFCLLQDLTAMERDPALKRLTWQHLQEFIADTKKEP